MNRTGRHHSDFCLASIPHLKLDPPRLCHVNKHFPWLFMWSMVKCPTSQGVTPTLFRVNNCIWVHGNSKTSCQHFAYPAGPKPEKQHADHVAQTRKQSIRPTICSRGRNTYVAFPSSVNTGHPSPALLPCVKKHFQCECLPRGKMQDGNIYLRTLQRQDRHMGLKGQGCSSHPPVQEPLLKMATDCAQLTLAVSHLEIPVLRFNLKTIIHHCFTHSRYFSRLKAQVNHPSF